jgi:hypothetical protein
MLRVAYGLAADGRTTKKGIPHNPLHVALLMRWSDMRLPGFVGLIDPIWTLLARVASWIGTERRLEERYR